MKYTWIKSKSVEIEVLAGKWTIWDTKISEKCALFSFGFRSSTEKVLEKEQI
jgi:hypothetical protein